MRYERALDIFHNVIMKGQEKGVITIADKIKAVNSRATANNHQVFDLVGNPSIIHEFEKIARYAIEFKHSGLDLNDEELIIDNWVIVQIGLGFNCLTGIKDKETNEISHKIVRQTNATSWGNKYPKSGNEGDYPGLLWHTCLIPLRVFFDLVQKGYAYRFGIKMGGNGKEHFIGAMLQGSDLDKEDSLLSPTDTLDHALAYSIKLTGIHYSPSGDESLPKLRGIVAFNEFITDYNLLSRYNSLVNNALPNAAPNVHDPTRGFNGSLLPLPYFCLSESSLTDFNESLSHLTSLFPDLEVSDKDQTESGRDHKLRRDLHKHFQENVINTKYKGDFNAFHKEWCEVNNLHYGNWDLHSSPEDDAQWTMRGMTYDHTQAIESTTGKSNCVSLMKDGTYQLCDNRSRYQGDLIVDLQYQLTVKEPGRKPQTQGDYKRYAKEFFNTWCADKPFKFVAQVDETVIDYSQGYLQALLNAINSCSHLTKTGDTLITFKSKIDSRGNLLEKGLTDLVDSTIIVEAFYEWMNDPESYGRGFYRLIETDDDEFIRVFLFYKNYRFSFAIVKTNNDFLKKVLTLFCENLAGLASNGNALRDVFWSRFDHWVGSPKAKHTITRCPDPEHRYVSVNNGVFDYYSNELIPHVDVPSHFKGKKVNCRTYFDLNFDPSKVDVDLLNEFISDFEHNVIDPVKPLIRPLVIITMCGLLGYLGVVWYLIGDGNTGKSTMLDILLKFMGKRLCKNYSDSQFIQLLEDESFLRDGLANANVLRLSEVNRTPKGVNFFKTNTGKLNECRSLLINKKNVDAREKTVTFGVIVEANEWISQTSEQRKENERRDLLTQFVAKSDFKLKATYKDKWTDEKIEKLVCTAMCVYEHSELLAIREMMDTHTGKYGEIFPVIRASIDQIARTETSTTIADCFAPSHYRDDEIESCIEKNTFYLIMSKQLESELNDANKKKWTNTVYSQLKNLSLPSRATGSKAGCRDELQSISDESLHGLNGQINAVNVKVVYGVEPTVEIMEIYNLIKVKTRKGLTMYLQFSHEGRNLQNIRSTLDSIYTSV